MDIESSRQPLIFGVTGHVEKEYITRAIESGMNKVYSKPLHLNEFGKMMIEQNYLTSMP